MQNRGEETEAYAIQICEVDDELRHVGEQGCGTVIGYQVGDNPRISRYLPLDVL